MTRGEHTNSGDSHSKQAVQDKSGVKEPPGYPDNVSRGQLGHVPRREAAQITPS